MFSSPAVSCHWACSGFVLPFDTSAEVTYCRNSNKLQVDLFLQNSNFLALCSRRSCSKKEKSVSTLVECADLECFRVDESGYTGFDLLNPDQRFQGASAIAISNEDAARLIKKHFSKLQAPELKYRSMSRRSTNHQQLLSIQRELISNYKNVTYVCDKRYLLILMFVDYAVEPFYYERGFNFYEDGQNYAMVSLLAIAGPTLLGQPAFDNMLAAFQHAVRDKTPEALNALVTATRWRELPEALGPLAQYAALNALLR